MALKTMDLSLEDYDDLLALYNDRLRRDGLTVRQDDDLSTQSMCGCPSFRVLHLKDQIYHDVACEWMNKPMAPRMNKRNYDRWSTFLKTKQKLRIGGIFPMKGTKFRAPELLPVAQMAQNDVNNNASILSNYHLELFISDGECRADVVMKNYIKIITNQDFRRYIVGILGEYELLRTRFAYHLLLRPFEFIVYVQ